MFPTAFSSPFSNQHSTALKTANHPIIPRFGVSSNKAAEDEFKALTRETVDEFKASNPHINTGQVGLGKRDLIKTFGHPNNFSSSKEERIKRMATGIEVATTARSKRTGKKRNKV